MVLSDVSRSVDGVERALTDMDLVTMAPIAFMSAGGMVLSQEAVDAVFPRFGLSSEPTSVRDLGFAALFKMGLAIALATGGNMVGGRAITAIAVVMAIGVLGHSGADIIDLGQKLLNRGGSSSSQTRRRARSSRSSASRQNRRSSSSRSPTSSRRSRSRTRASSPDAKQKERQTWG